LNPFSSPFVLLTTLANLERHQFDGCGGTTARDTGVVHFCNHQSFSICHMNGFIMSTNFVVGSGTDGGWGWVWGWVGGGVQSWIMQNMKRGGPVVAILAIFQDRRKITYVSRSPVMARKQFTGHRRRSLTMYTSILTALLSCIHALNCNQSFQNPDSCHVMTIRNFSFFNFSQGLELLANKR